MPPFQSLVTNGQKRKSESSDTLAIKRVALGQASEVPEKAGYWVVQWRNPQYKKHKTWDGDGVLVLAGSSAMLYDTEGNTLARGSFPEPFEEGREYKIGGREFEIDRTITRHEFLSGSCFGRGFGSSSSTPAPANTAGPSKQFKPLTFSQVHTSRVSDDQRRDIPLHPVSLAASTVSSSNADRSLSKSEIVYWTANWRKPQQKKNKTWDGDGFVSLSDGKLMLISEDGKILGSSTWKGVPLCNGYICYIGSREVELESQVSASRIPRITGVGHEDYESPPASQEQKSFLIQATVAATPSRPASPLLVNSASYGKKFVTPISFYAKPARPKGPLHDPGAEGAVVMKAPNKDHESKFNKKNLPIVPVVLDPVLARQLRPHQKEGVQFLYECVMGLRKHEGQGCILADDMGLGKTLQTISLVWTLLKQNPYAGAPVIGKALIVCPVTLINNWKAEFHKWLGRDRIGIFVADKDKAAIKQFINSKTHQVLIIGYERLRTIIDDLAFCNPPIGLIVCDEGHRLKSANNKTSAMFKALRTPRRIILSGTPIQNDLSEFHAMADFCNPGLLDDYSTFRKVYEVPIMKSRAPDCSAKEAEVGGNRSKQLMSIARSFVLRREGTILKKYLPPKYEYVVFVTPTKLQLSIFSTILNSDRLDSLVQSSTAESLALIGMLTKISNSPVLLKATSDNAKNKDNKTLQRPGVEESLKLLPPMVRFHDVSLSGKLTMLGRLLAFVKEHTEEKCVLVSHYTSTLTILEEYCKTKRYTYFRLDGQTPAAKRQEYVNIFNKSSQQSRFIFLLSSKAGGVGLNLVGASRLCLIDSDWNPSHDLQSMARIHRDGQKRPVFIYRFLTAGTIDEKIFQRQVTKIGLSDSLMGTGTSESKSDSFSRKDLRDIFRVYPNTGCNTHDLLECPCDGPASQQEEDMDVLEPLDIDSDPIEDESETSGGFINAARVKPQHISKVDRSYLIRKKAELASLGEWKHINCLRPAARAEIRDDILRKLFYVPPSLEKSKESAAQHQSRAESLLSAIDIENISMLEAENQTLAVKDIPGGSLSFLFERVADSALLKEQDEREDEAQEVDV